MTAGPAKRRRAGAFGRRAELAALLWLMGKGYRPLARNVVCKGGELDLVVRRGRTIAFVEVKAREGLDAAMAAVTAQKRARIERAARTWLARHPQAAALTLRGDAVFLAPGRWPRHIADAFPLQLA